MVAKVTAAQRACLLDASEGPLVRQRHGWANRGDRGHATNTVEALAKRGLMRVKPLSGCMGTAHITMLGKELVRQLSGSADSECEADDPFNPYGSGPVPVEERA